MNVAGIAAAVATITAIVLTAEADTIKDGFSGYARDSGGGLLLPYPPPPPPPPLLSSQDRTCGHQHPQPVFHLPAVACDTFTIHKSETPPHTLLQLLLPARSDGVKTTSCVSPDVPSICKPTAPAKTSLLGSLLSLF